MKKVSQNGQQLRNKYLKTYQEIVMEGILEKISELPDAMHPNNIEVGRVVVGDLFADPQVGKCFWVGWFRTSIVKEIIDENTFRTCNSIYRLTKKDE